jgi:BlaI family penicillinase repressor
MINCSTAVTHWRCDRGGTEKRCAVSQRTRIIECLWRESPRTIVGIWHALEDETGWSKSTVNTLLGRMAEKGLVRYEEGHRAREYYPCVAREAAAAAETRSLLERVYRGSVGL